jgi:hypothetical protein
VSSAHIVKKLQAYSQHETLPQAYIHFCNEHNISLSLKLTLRLEEYTIVFQAEVNAMNESAAENIGRGYRNRNETFIFYQIVWH